MKRDDQDRLLRDLLASDDVERLRAMSLARMLDVARSRRRRRALVSCAAASVAIAAILLAVGRPPARVPVLAAAPAPAPSRVKIITDDELFRLFPDRSVALVGAPGRQTFMLLDRAAPPPATTEKP